MRVGMATSQTHDLYCDAFRASTSETYAAMRAPLAASAGRGARVAADPALPQPRVALPSRLELELSRGLDDQG
jgi:hypothetical protein